jgi:hypothetical protein
MLSSFARQVALQKGNANCSIASRKGWVLLGSLSPASTTVPREASVFAFKDFNGIRFPAATRRRAADEAMGRGRMVASRLHGGVADMWISSCLYPTFRSRTDISVDGSRLV